MMSIEFLNKYENHSPKSEIERIEKIPLIKNIVLTYFDSIRGPTVLYNSDNDIISSNLQKVIVSLMDIVETNEEFFIYGQEDSILLNHRFVINSRWGRGFVESVMITFIVAEDNYDLDVKEKVQTFSKQFVQAMRKDKEIYKGFYHAELANESRIAIGNKNEIIEKSEKIKKLFQQASKFYCHYFIC